MAGNDLDEILNPSERVLTRVPVAGFHASKRDTFGVTEVVLTDSRYLALSQRGMLRKRSELAAAWSHTGFTERINTSEGAALGPYLHLLTLFTADGETVSAGFRTPGECENFKMQAAGAVGQANGWT